MVSRYLDWQRQAEADLRHFQNALKSGDYEWCWLAAHQAAEKSVKSLFRKIGANAWGHTITVPP